MRPRPALGGAQGFGPGGERAGHIQGIGQGAAEGGRLGLQKGVGQVQVVGPFAILANVNVGLWRGSFYKSRQRAGRGHGAETQHDFNVARLLDQRRQP